MSKFRKLHKNNVDLCIILYLLNYRLKLVKDAERMKRMNKEYKIVDSVESLRDAFERVRKAQDRGISATNGVRCHYRLSRLL